MTSSDTTVDTISGRSWHQAIMKGDPPQASKVRQSRRLRKKKEQREEMAIEKAKRKQQKQKKKMRMMKNARTQQKKTGRGKSASATKTTTKNTKTGERKRKKQPAATSSISWIDPSITPQPRSNRIAPVPLATLEGVCMRPGIRGTQTAGRLAAYARTIIFTGDKGGSVRTFYFPPTMIFIFPVDSMLHLFSSFRYFI